MKYLLYCDLDTVDCSESTLENIISQNSNAYLRISDNLWALDVWKEAFAHTYQSVPMYYIEILLDDFLNDNSVCFIQEINRSLHAEHVFPSAAYEFLFDETEDD